MKKILLISILFLSFVSSVFPQTISQRFDRGMEAYHKGDFLFAYQILDSLSNDSVDDEIASTSKFFCADALLNLNQFNAASVKFEDFISSFPLSNFREMALYKLGLIYFRNNEFAKCRNRLTEMLNEFPNSEFIGTAFYWIGESYVADNRFNDAENFFKDAISSEKNNKFVDYSLFSLASLYERTGNYPDAVKYYDELLSYYNDSRLAPSAKLRIGVCYFNLKDYDKAILELTDPGMKELSESEEAEAQYVLASSFFKLKEYKNAADIYEEIVKRFPDEEKADKYKYGLAWVYFQMKKYEDAYRIFTVLSNSHDDSIAVKSLYWSAESKRYSGDLQSALNIYKLFLSRYPAHELASEVKVGIGFIYNDTGQPEYAENYLLTTLDSADDNSKAKANNLLGDLSFNKKDFGNAADYYSSVIKVASISDDIFNHALLGLGMSQFYLNQFEESIGNLNDLTDRASNYESGKTNFYLAENNFALGDFTEAAAYYNNVKSSDPELSKQTLYGKAYAYFNLKDFANSSYYFNDYYRLYPNDENTADAQLRLADSYYGLKNFDKASETYRAVFSRKKELLNNDFAYYQYGQALFKAGRPYEAIDQFTALQEKFSRSKYADDSQYLIGWIYFQQNKFNEAIENYNKISNRYPGSAVIPISYYSIGDCYYNLGNYETAINYYAKLLNEYPNTQFVYDAVTGIQYCYVAEGQPSEAVNFIDRFLSSNPGSPYADKISFKKGEIYYSNGDYESAKSAYKEFLARYPKSRYVPDAYYWIGKSASNLGQSDEAAYNLTAVIDEHLDSEIGITAVLELAKIYTDRKEYQKVINLYTTAISSLPDSKRMPEMLYNKGIALLELNKIPDAYQTFNQIISSYDESLFASKAKIELGILELARKSYENAEILFRDLGEKKLDDIGAQSQYYFGLTLFEQGKINEAINAFVRVRSVFSAYDEWLTKSLLRLGDCYIKLNDKVKAREMFKAVLQRHRGNEYANEANEKLKKL